MRQALEEEREQVEWKGEFEICLSSVLRMSQRDTSWVVECQENTKALNYNSAHKFCYWETLGGPVYMLLSSYNIPVPTAKHHPDI